MGHPVDRLRCGSEDHACRPLSSARSGTRSFQASIIVYFIRAPSSDCGGIVAALSTIPYYRYYGISPHGDRADNQVDLIVVRHGDAVEGERTIGGADQRFVEQHFPCR